METLNRAVFDQLQRVINKIIFLKKKDIFAFKGVKLYPSEIHLMMLVQESSAANATKMAERLGVTKGAVSQTMSRLETKGILRKEKDPYNKNELTLTFTPLGAEAFAFYSKITAEIYQAHAACLERYSRDEKEVIQKFLRDVENIFQTLE